MKDYLLGAFQVDESDIENITYICYKDKNIYLNNNQKFELSKSKKTIYIVQYDENMKEYAKKGFRVSSCLFFQELYN